MSDLLSADYRAIHAIIAGCWALCAGVVSWYVGLAAVDITYVTLADGQQQQRRLPLMFRLLLPLTPNVRLYNGPRSERLRGTVERQLISSGYDTLLSPQQFLAMKILMPCVLGPLFIMLMWAALQEIPGTFGAGLLKRQAVFYLLIMLFFYIYPMRWLRREVKARHKIIERALPFVLDLLTLSVEAGLDFMSSIKRIIDRREVDALSEEMIRMFREMQVGRTRKEALKDMAERINNGDVRSVVNALVQADELGVSIGSILRIQSDQMRTRRFQRAEKLGNEAPVKLLFPLTCFIFPAVFIVLLGPIFIEMIKKGGM
jgi:tight adherence protein C